MKNKILKLSVEGDVYENKELNERADSLTNYKEAIVKKYETTIRSQKKSTFKVVLSIFKVAFLRNSKSLKIFWKVLKNLVLTSQSFHWTFWSLHKSNKRNM